MDRLDRKLAILGLGYVGFPLAMAFSKKRAVKGFDISERRIQELRTGIDCTHEFSSEDILSATRLNFSHQLEDIADCDFYIVTVPTPVDAFNRPDFSLLIKASRMLASILKNGDIVVYESTVYPGAIREICVPEIEEVSGLRLNDGFFVGYSPERVNPGDKTRSIEKIKKITSGSNPETAVIVDKIYQEIIEVGTYMVSSIEVAEAAKVIENTQRDVNIALINELAMIFNRLGLDTEEVLLAAETKWNFMKFRPGLVGGHCIGVDPYYLTHKAQALNYQPELILAGRHLNDHMGEYVAQNLVKQMLKAGVNVNAAKVLILGFTFKENCPDTRNTKVIDIVKELHAFQIHVDIYDPVANAHEVQEEYGLTLIQTPIMSEYDSIIIAVAHDEFKHMGSHQIRTYGKAKHLLYDLKYVLSAEESDLRL